MDTTQKPCGYDGIPVHVLKLSKWVLSLAITDLYKNLLHNPYKKLCGLLTYLRNAFENSDNREMAKVTD